MVRMERHKCKLCSRSFSSGRALGGHMRSHLANLPLPPKTPQKQENRYRPPPAPPGCGGGNSAEPSTSSDCPSATTNNEEHKGAPGVYGLRKNPKKSLRLADPLSLDAAGLVFVQDGESEAESIKNPTRKRSKRARKMPVSKQLMSSTTDQSNVELEQVSSASNTSPEEDLAMCLIMLSRDVWSSSVTTATTTTTTNNNTSITSSDEYSQQDLSKLCNKVMNGSKSTCEKIKIDCCDDEEVEEEVEMLEEFPRNVVVACSSTANNKNVVDQKVHECQFCGKVFGSGQALGGQKRSHLLRSTTTITATTSTAASVSNSAKLGAESLLLPTSNSSKLQDGMFVIDLNLPAPMEDEEEENNHHHGRTEQDLFFRQEGSAVLRS